MLPPARSREQPHVAHDQHGFLRPGAASSGNSNRAGHRVDHLSEKAISDGHKLLYGCVGSAYSPPSSATPPRGAAAPSSPARRCSCFDQNADVSGPIDDPLTAAEKCKIPSLGSGRPAASE